MKKLIIIHGKVYTAHDQTRSTTEKQVYSPFATDLSFDVSYSHLLKNASIGSPGLEGFETYIASPNFVNGKIGKAWKLEEGIWAEVNDVSPDIILNRFTNPLNQNYRGKASFEEFLKTPQAANVKIFNLPKLDLICKDKLRTSQEFPEFSIPTRLLEKTEKLEEKLVLETIKSFEIQGNSDFKENTYILKPRAGSGGEGIHVIETKQDKLKTNIISSLKEDYILQPYLDTKQGVLNRTHDLRVFLVNGRLVCSELRTSNKSKQQDQISTYLCPKGDIVDTSVVGQNEIPLEFSKIYQAVDSRLKEFETRFYSVDMAMGKSGKAYLFELNSRARETWNEGDPKELIGLRKTMQLETLKAIAKYSEE